MFIYAQGFGVLVDTQVHVDAAYEVQPGILKTVFDKLDQGLCQSKNITVDCSAADDGQNLMCYYMHCGELDADMEKKEYTYMESMRDLWNWKGEYWTRVSMKVSTIILVFASLIWPHVKLAILHVLFYMKWDAQSRRSGYYWAALWGKWSFFDVVVMFAMIGVFQVGFTIPYTNSERTGLVDLIMAMLGNICEGGKFYETSICPKNDPVLGPCCTSGNFEDMPVFSRIPCSAICNTLWSQIKKAAHDDLQGELHAGVGVQGRPGMYIFCVAVILSLVTGMVLDSLDGRFRRSGGAYGDDSNPQDCEENSENTEECQEVDSHKTYTRKECIKTFMAVVMVLIAAGLIVGTLPLVIFQRRVTGTIPEAFLKMDGNQTLDYTYTLPQLAHVQYKFGGTFLWLCFIIFIIAGGLVRLVTLFAGLLMPGCTPHCFDVYLARFSRHAAAFYAVELMVLAVPLLNWTFGPISSKTLRPDQFKPCQWLQNQTNTTGEPCMEIQVEMKTGYWVMLVSWLAFAVVGYSGSPVHRLWHKRVAPHDVLPPVFLERKCK
eukprot:TRINITY_DN9130_c0_g1_i1.p1 TRINITY_DN9130_c0_g1~~TRINITY_DN9130_c0_g1_i1.p1  ORF type:complete len:600 (+),score=95.77 TRINITY_DN9130_c0_g1_i1:163-1800(+)